MTSRNSFWKFSEWNFKKRAWALVVLFVVWFFILPVYVFSKAGTMIQGMEQGLQPVGEKIWISTTIMNTGIPGGGLYGILVAAMGIFLALQGFSWNNHQSRVDMYKSVPVKDNTRFWYINLNSLWIFVLSFGVNMVLANLSATIWGVWNRQFLGASVFSFVIHLLLFVSVYFVTLIAQGLTGNIVLGFCGASVLLLIEPACFLLRREMMSLFYHTYMKRGVYEVLQDGVFSPLSLYIGAYKSVSMKNGGFAQPGNYGEIWTYLLIFLVQIILYGSVAWLVYCKRPAQTGGRAMLFPKTKPVIKCVIMILGSLGFSVFLARFDERAKVWYGFFGVICALCILQVVLQVIMEGDFKEALKGKVSFAAAAVVTLAVFAVTAFDLTGFDSYLPEEEKIESFAFVRANDYIYNYFDENQNPVTAKEYLMENMKIEDAVAKNLLFSELTEAIENDEYYYKEDTEEISGEYEEAATVNGGNVYEDGNSREPVYIKFRLTSGKEVVRSYYLPRSRIRNCYYYLYDLAEYKECVYSVLKDDIAEEFLKADNHNYAYYCAYPSAWTSDDNTKDPILVEELFCAMQSDLRNRSSETIMTMAPVGELNFATNYTRSMEDKSIYFSIPVYEADRETMAVLKEKEWFRSADISGENVSAIHIYQYQENDNKRKLMIIEPENPFFEPVLEAFCFSERANDVVDSGAFTKRGYYVEIETADGYRSYSGYLFVDKFPKELEKAFENVDYDEEFPPGVG